MKKTEEMTLQSNGASNKGLNCSIKILLHAFNFFVDAAICKCDEILTNVPDEILVVQSCKCGSLTEEGCDKDWSLAALIAELPTFNLMTNMEDPCSKISSFKTTPTEVQKALR